jgi:DNA polymerase III delta subunit
MVYGPDDHHRKAEAIGTGVTVTVKYPNAKLFRQELERHRLDPAYLFLGEEEGEKDKYINRIIEMALPDQYMRTNAAGRFHIENEEFNSAVDFALSPSMFSSCRVCVMYNLNGLQFQ